MTSFIWRTAHFTLALLSSLFIFIAATTGVILAYDALDEKLPAYQTEQLDHVSIAQSLPILKSQFPEILEIAVDHNDVVSVSGFDEEGEEVHVIVNPLDGRVLSNPQEKSAFIQWVTSLHRSLFLHETGRFIVGIASVLLLLITLTGAVLIAKRQLGIRHFLGKVKKDYFAQFYHIFGGRLFLIPILMISLTGIFLFMVRFEIVKAPENQIEIVENNGSNATSNLAAFPIFKETTLDRVEKIEFPFSDDAEEVYVLKLKDRILEVNQSTGQITKSELLPELKLLERLSLNLHTGRTAWWWALILGLACIHLLFFIYSGFVMTYKRMKNSTKNNCSPEEAELVILVGSEGGSTRFFASKVVEQLQSQGVKVYMDVMNSYQAYDNASRLLIFTSTYGVGEAPSNANFFLSRLKKQEPLQPIQVAVVAFGSKQYTDFCAFGIKVFETIKSFFWADVLVPLHLINDGNREEFVMWVQEFNQTSKFKLSEVPSFYQKKTPKKQRFTLVNTPAETLEEDLFEVRLKTPAGVTVKSGDLLAVYPSNRDTTVRYYSIAQMQRETRLFVKLHERGLGSNYLFQLQSKQTIKASWIQNEGFHFPQNATGVLFIGNGTGIAPFLGMLSENVHHIPVHLYCGFKRDSNSIQKYAALLNQYKEDSLLASYNFAFSRALVPQYVMDLIKADQEGIAEAIHAGYIVMICGSLAMQRDVELELDRICQSHLQKTLAAIKQNNQIKTDCY